MCWCSPSTAAPARSTAHAAPALCPMQYPMQSSMLLESLTIHKASAGLQVRAKASRLAGPMRDTRVPAQLPNNRSPMTTRLLPSLMYAAQGGLCYRQVPMKTLVGTGDKQAGSAYAGAKQSAELAVQSRRCSGLNAGQAGGRRRQSANKVAKAEQTG